VRALLARYGAHLLAVFLFVPLALVFAKAFAGGLAAYWAAIRDPVALAAVRLTLTAAAIAVPVNFLFGLAAAWAIAKFRFPGKGLPDHPDRPAVSVLAGDLGDALRLLFGAHGLPRPWLIRHDVKILFAVPGIVLATMFVTSPMVAREPDPPLQSQGTTRRRRRSPWAPRGCRPSSGSVCRRSAGGSSTASCSATPGRWGEFGAVSVVSGHIRGVTKHDAAPHRDPL